MPTMNNTKFSQTKNPAVILSAFKKRTSKESPAYTKTFHIFIKNRTSENHANVGVATVISNKHVFTQITLNLNLESIAISISFPKSIHICNIYVSNNSPLIC